MLESTNRKFLKCVTIVLISDVFASTNGYHFYTSSTVAEHDYEDYYNHEIESTTEELIIHPLPERMDLITIVWYFSTFIALIAFFIYMACADKCHRRKPTVNARPVTPAPSYKNFAPPSYDTAIKKMKSARVFIVPVHGERNVFNNETVVDSPRGPTNADVEASNDNRNALHL